MVKALTLGVRAHDVGLEELPSFFSAEAIEILAERVLSRNFHAVQFTMADAFKQVKPAHLNQGMAWQLRNAFESRNIQIAVLSCYINPIHPDHEKRKKDFDCFYRYLEFCRDLGCNYVATETGSKNIDGSFHPDNHSPRAMEELLDSLKLMVSCAEKFGIGIAIEGVSKYVARSPEVIMKILENINSGNLRVILDPVNMLEPAADSDIQQQYVRIVDESFSLFGDNIIAIHLKDYKFEEGKIVKTPIGTGSAPFNLLLKLAAERKPGLPLIMEEQKPVTMDSSFGFINGLIPELN